MRGLGQPRSVLAALLVALLPVASAPSASAEGLRASRHHVRAPAPRHRWAVRSYERVLPVYGAPRDQALIARGLAEGGVIRNYYRHGGPGCTPENVGYDGYYGCGPGYVSLFPLYPLVLF